MMRPWKNIKNYRWWAPISQRLEKSNSCLPKPPNKRSSRSFTSLRDKFWNPTANLNWFPAQTKHPRNNLIKISHQPTDQSTKYKPKLHPKLRLHSRCPISRTQDTFQQGAPTRRLSRQSRKSIDWPLKLYRQLRHTSWARRSISSKALN
jgi:hypothetical protein